MVNVDTSSRFEKTWIPVCPYEKVLVCSFNDLMADSLPDLYPLSKWEWQGPCPEGQST